MPRRAASEAISGDGLGSRMVSEDAARPAWSHPCAIAPPILPAPTRTRRAGHCVIFDSRSAPAKCRNKLDLVAFLPWSLAFGKRVSHRPGGEMWRNKALHEPNVFG